MLKDGLVSKLQEKLRDLDKGRLTAEERCEAAEAELDETKSKFLRLNADFDNFRKRAVSCSAEETLSLSYCLGKRKR